MAAAIRCALPALVALAACGAPDRSPTAAAPAPPAPAEAPRAIPEPPPPPASAPAPRTSPRRYLGDDFERLSPDRARVARYGVTRVNVEAATPGPHPGRRVWPVSAAPELVVVDVHDRLVRVVVDEENARLLLWIERADLFLVVTETAVVAPGPEDPAPGGHGVTVYPGLPIPSGVNERRDDRVLVHYSEEARFSGWLPAADLGDIYVPVDLEEGDATEWFVAGGTRILDAPDGKEVARFGMGRQSTHGVRVLGEESGHREIEFVGSRFRVRGFVPAGSVHPGTATGGYTPRGWGRLGAGVRPISLPAGTCLFDGPGGQVVGTVMADSGYAGGEREGSWQGVSVTTRWGRIPVWVGEREGGGYRLCD